MEKEYEIKESSGTDSPKATDIEYRSFVEEPGDDDGENRNPKDRNTIIETSFLITKSMIGSGLLLVPYHFKTLGIFISIGSSILFNLITFISSYFLLRCKDVTQRYSYAVYSRMALGYIGTVSCKFAILIKSISLCCVYLKMLGNILRTFLLIFFPTYSDKFFLDAKFLLLIFAILITPLMVQKDISGISKFTFLGIYSIVYLFISLLILFIYKYSKDEILPFEPKMFYPSGTKFELFKCFGSYLNAYFFQVSIFPIYLPLHPRTTKNMMISTAIGTIFSSIIYISFGIIGFFIYNYDINGTLLPYLGNDLINYIKTNKKMALLLIIFEIAFIINTSISLALNFFSAKSKCIGIAKSMLKKYQKKKDDESILGTQLESLDESGYTIEKSRRKESEEIILNERSQIIITILIYIITVVIAYYSDNIIAIDNFNGSTVNNYLSAMLPGLFFLILIKEFGNCFEKLIAVILILFSIALIAGYFLFNFTSIFA